jgi:soluble lytic murein transglycosylase-like protein
VRRTTSSLLLTLLFPLAFSCGGVIDPELLAWARTYAGGFGLDEDLVVSVIWVESRFCTTAVSPKGAIGLGQFMPGTAAELGIDPHDPRQNLWATAKYLREKYLEWEDWTLALAAYNAGSGAVRRFGGIPPYAETQHYVKEVLRVYSILKQQRR